MADGDALTRLSEEVADAAPIDWNHYESFQPGERSTVQQLRLIATIARVHRAANIGSASTKPSSQPGHIVLVKGQQWGPLRIIETIAEGSFGRVYRAHDPDLERDVALKVLGRHSRQLTDDELVREARVLAKVEHENVVTVHGAKVIDGEVGLWMELIKGKTLAAWVAEHGPMSATEAAVHGAELCRAVAAVHQANLLHRDIKAQNVMRADDGRIVLMDFGAVRDALDASASAVGTPVYLAPEVLEGQDGTRQSDLYSVGVLLFFMVTGQFPVTASMLAELRERHARGQVLQLRDVRPGLPPAFVDVVGRALAADPARRYQSAGELEQALLNTIGSTPAVTAGSGTSTDKTPRRYWWAAAAAVLTASLVTVTLLNRRDAGAPVLPAPAHLVALPCSPIGSEASALCSGFSEALVARLLRLTATHRLQVTPQIGGLAGTVVEVAEARHSLGATRILQGVMPPAPASDVQFVISGADGAPLETLALTPDANVFEAEERAVAWLVRLLDLSLTHVERESLLARGTSNAVARTAYLRGRGHLARNNVADAIGAFTDALAADEAYADAHVGLGMAWRAQFLRDRDAASFERARAACDASIRLQPNHSAGRTCLGMLHFAGRRLEDASAELARAVEADPTNDDAVVWLGRTQEDLRLFSDAERLYQRAIERRPTYFTTRTWLANFYRRQGRYEQAAGALGEAVALVPGNARLRAALATPMAYLGRYDEAIALLEDAVEIQPTREAYLAWGMTLFRMHRFAEAVAKIEQAKQLGTDVTILGALGRAHYWWGTPDARARARAFFTEAIALAERDLQRPTGRLPSPDLHLAAADFCAKVERPADARAHLAKAAINPDDPNRPTDPHQLFYGALVYAQLGDRDLAIKWLERAVYWGVPAAELHAWMEFDGLRPDPAFQRLIRPN